jgi:hypothetical protein
VEVEIGMSGEVSRLSLATCPSSTKAAFGGESAGGGGIPLADVVQSGGSPSALVAVQPAGKSGGVTASKLSAKVVSGVSQAAVAASSTSVVVVELEPSKPPAATSRLPIALPAM